MATSPAPVTPSGSDAMELLRRLLADTTLRAIRGARPITFWLDGQAWTLDPKDKALVVEGAAAAPALTVRTSPALLIRLLTERDLVLGKEDVLGFEGDPRALAPVVDALHGGKSALMTRIDVSTPRNSKTLNANKDRS